MSSKLLLRSLLIAGTIATSGCAQTISLEKVSRRYQKASRYHQAYLAQHPEDLPARMRLARFYYDFREYSQVKALLEGLSSWQAQTLLAKTYAHLKENDYAIALFEQIGKNEAIVNECAKDGEYSYLYGEVLESKNLFGRAAQEYQKVKGPLYEVAQERIQAIRSKTESKLPSYIEALALQAEQFAREMKDEAAVVYLVDERVEVTEDNREVSTIHVIEQVLQERGKELAEIEIGYDSTYERIELEFARSVSPEGVVVNAGKENIRDVSRYLNFPLYSNARAFIVSMPLVEVGSFIEYKIKIYSSKMINEDDLTIVYRLREKNPIFKARFTLLLPRQREVHYKFFNPEYSGTHDFVPREEVTGPYHKYLWEFDNIEPLIPEYNMPPASRVNPAVLISSFSSWDEVYRWWQELFEDKLDLDDVGTFVSQLIQGETSDREKAKKIYEFCAKNIRYVAIEYGDSGHEPHHAQEVFRNRYGDCKDQAVLLTAMLRFAGIDAYPVLIPTRGTYGIEEAFPSVNFNHVICAVSLDGELIFMDPTAETTPFGRIPLGDQEREVMVFLDDTWRIVTTPAMAENVAEYRMEISINDEEDARITRSVTTQGFFADAYRAYLKYTHPLHIKEDIQRRMTEISSFARLIDYSVEHKDDLDARPLLTYTFTTRKFLNPARDLRIIPPLDDIYIEHNLIGKENRNFPVDFESVLTKRSTVNIMLPSVLSVKHIPFDTRIDNQWFCFTARYAARANTVSITKEFTIKKRFVLQEEYGAFKQELERVLYLLREEVILKRNDG